MTVASRLPTLSEIESPHNWRVRVDIIDAPALQLVLPARKEMVENEALSRLREAVPRSRFTMPSPARNRIASPTRPGRAPATLGSLFPKLIPGSTPGRPMLPTPTTVTRAR
ncbi:hypothetical protein ACFSUK_04385 [Sphingobium scionense]